MTNQIQPTDEKEPFAVELCRRFESVKRVKNAGTRSFEWTDVLAFINDFVVKEKREAARLAAWDVARTTDMADRAYEARGSAIKVASTYGPEPETPKP